MFGFLANAAFADVNFSAINGANTRNEYSLSPTNNIQVGVIYSDDNNESAEYNRVLLCNSAYGQPRTHKRWQSKCEDFHKLTASTKLRVQAYYRSTKLPFARWRCATPSFVPQPGALNITWNSWEGEKLGQTVVSGMNLMSTGVDSCQSNGLRIKKSDTDNS
jgi:hypothetical protein